jgi:hypothetical protein
MNTRGERSFWTPGIKQARAVARVARETLVFLHIAKSGGTSLRRAIEASDRWQDIEFPYPPLEATLPTRRRFWRARGHKSWVSAAKSVKRQSSSDKSLFIWGGHPTYSHSKWLAEQLTVHENTPTVVMTYRPSRERTISRFRDYWARVQLADIYSQESWTTVPEGPFRNRYIQDLKDFYRDSLNYRDDSGRIDGARWFRDISANPNFPFLLCEVFASPEQLTGALDSHKLKVIQLLDLDQEILELTGVEFPRARVSPPVPPEVSRAIDESLASIDQMVQRDTEFERVVTAHISR